MRFAPPRVTLPVELAWLLGAAFGPELPPPAGDPERAAELARSFDLGPRIIARHGSAPVRQRLGAAAGEMIGAHRRAVAVALIAERTARRVAELAAQSGLAVTYLKGLALQLLAPGPIGSRALADIDVLLSRSGAAELRARLIDDGWVSAEEAGNPQHLPPVRAPWGLPVDIHFRLRGVRVAASRWANADELLASGLCRPAGLGKGTWMPGPVLMAAHLAVHALEQHGHRPATYPLLRAAADVADLSAASAGEDLTAAAAALVGETLGETELRSLFDLGRVLAEGRTPEADGDGESAAAVLLRHIVAGALDPAYRRGLVIDHTAERLRQARRDGALMRYIALKIRGPRGPSEAGSRESPQGLESVGGRLLHPIRVGLRLASAAIARLRQTLKP